MFRKCQGWRSATVANVPENSVTYEHFSFILYLNIYTIKPAFVKMINSQEEAIKSCPFCGEHAVLDKVNKTVYCSGCECELRADLFTSIEEIIDQWNKL